MASPLEKARKAPESMKARILTNARRVFGEYGFHGTTTRMIATEVGIDISTLHYHWGEKKDLYEAVVMEIYKDMGQQLIDVEKVIHGRPLAERLAVSIDMMTDYLFAHPEISNLVLLRYFGKTRHDPLIDTKVPEFTADIARSMDLSKTKKNASPRAMMEVWTLINSIHNFVTGKTFFQSMVKLDEEQYVALVKETLKVIHIPAFTQRG
jgi:AcrR family transcriptional regulator